MTTVATTAANPEDQVVENLPSAQVHKNFLCRHIPEFAVLAAWTGVAGFTLHYHEKWADEAQAWLLARDLDLYTLWFKELRYEGSPGLWHTILWVAQHVFHAPYAAIGVIGMVCAMAGVALMLFTAPFPRPLRWLLAFTYFMVYQYAVIARPYTLLPFLAFAAAILFKDLKHPERMTIVLILLANLSFHGTILAGCLGFAYLVDAVKSWSTLGDRLQGRYVLCVGAMALTFLVLFVILKPTPDVEDIVVRNVAARLQGPGRLQQPSMATKLRAVVSGAFFDEPVTSSIFLLLAGAWCFVRRRLLTFALPVVLMITLYAIVHGYPHHHGTVFVAAITGLWIAWPTVEEQHGFTIRERRAAQGIVALLVCLFCLNIWDSAVAIRHEMLYPYSGAGDAARYLRSVGADRKPIFGYLYGMVGVQAYFDHNIAANVPTAYFHHGLPLTGNLLDLEDLRRKAPDYIVLCFGTQRPQQALDQIYPRLRSEGYELAHFSDGYFLYKRSVFERQVYFIFRRTGPTILSGEQISLPSDPRR